MYSELDLKQPQKRGRREIATILFADIVDSTAHILNRDEELAEQILDQAIHTIRTCIHSYGGTIARIQGDGVMAVFGAPQFVEDHVARACHAACDIKDNFTTEDSGLRVRIGVHSGHILTRIQKGDFGTVFDVVGAAVHIAAKAERRAPPNGVVITQEVVNLLTKRASIENLPALELPESDPISLYALHELDQRPEDKLVELSSSPLEGRAAELKILAPIWQQQNDPQQQTIGVVGEAGIGKSRLAAEVAILGRKEGHQILSLYGLSILQATPYAALKSFLTQLLNVHQRCFGMSAADSNPDILQNWLLASQDPSRGVVTPRALADAVIEMLSACTQQQPVLWVIEDVQDLDPESWDWIQALLKALKPIAVSTIVTARPQQERHLSAVCDQVLELQPLDPSAARNLAERIVRPETGEAAIIDEIVQRSEGVPFFVKELSRISHANAADTLPLTVENLVVARLDALSREAEHFVASASVLGTEFEIPRAVALMAYGSPFKIDAIVNELIAQHVIKRAQPGRLRFSHQIYADVARSRLLTSRRSQLHARAATALSATHTQIAENAEQIAYHYHAAGQLDEAVKYQLKACKFAVARSANHSVMDLFRRGFILREQIGAEAQKDLCDLILASVDSLLQLGQTALLIEALNYVIAFGESAQNARCTALARGNLAFLYWFLGRQRSAEEQISAALSLPVEAQDLPVQSVILFAHAVIQHAKGALTQAVNIHQNLIDLLTHQPDKARYGASLFPIVRSRAFKAWSLCELGLLGRALQECDLAEKDLGRMTQPYSRLLIQAARGKALNGLGDYAAAESALRESQAICLREQQWGMEPCISGWLATALAGLGRHDEALRVAQDSYKTKRYRAGGPAAQCELLYVLSNVALLAGQFDLAEEALATGQDIAQRSNENVGTAYLAFTAAKLQAAKAPASPAIQEAFQTSIELATPYKLLPLIAEQLTVLADVSERLGETRVATAQRQEAAKLRAECGMAPSVISHRSA